MFIVKEALSKRLGRSHLRERERTLNHQETNIKRLSKYGTTEHNIVELLYRMINLDSVNEMFINRHGTINFITTVSHTTVTTPYLLIYL